DNASLYKQPEDIWDVYYELSQVSDMFTIATAFGNVHGVYKPGIVKLTLHLLKKHQEYVKKQLNSKFDKPIWFVFHCDSCSVKDKIKEAVSYSVIKINYYEGKKGFLQSQVGNPEGENNQTKYIIILVFLFVKLKKLWLNI
ncbi:hypothetical protein C1646_791123, partial [Rhizophagus diaphanus]